MSAKNKTLNLVLTFEWFDKIKRGEKTHEYRKCSGHWSSIIERDYEKVRFQRGFSKNPEKMTFEIKSISIIDGQKSDLKCFEKVYDIELGKRIE